EAPADRAAPLAPRIDVASPTATPGSLDRAEAGGSAEPPPHPTDVVVYSDYAGAFFLINVAIDLELYSHRITVVEDLELGVWRFIEVVARELLGEHDADDALWELLKSLAEPARSPTLPDAKPDLSPAERARLVGRVRAHLEALLDVEDPGGFLIRRRGR